MRTFRLGIAIVLATFISFSAKAFCTSNKIIKENFSIKDIPVTVCYSNECAQNTLLILSHGFNGSKENWNDKMEVLAQKGYYTVAFDNRYHGERKDISLEEKVMTKEGLIDVVSLRKLISETASDVSVLIDYFMQKKPLKFEEIGMIGISLGGYITYTSLVNDERISFAVPLISTPFWDDIPENPIFLRTPESIKELKEYSNLKSPATHINKIVDHNILGLIGKNDTHFDVARVIEFYDKLKDTDTNPQGKFKIELKIYDVAHEVNATMWNDVLSWLQEL